MIEKALLAFGLVLVVEGLKPFSFFLLWGKWKRPTTSLVW